MRHKGLVHCLDPYCVDCGNLHVSNAEIMFLPASAMEISSETIRLTYMSDCHDQTSPCLMAGPFVGLVVGRGSSASSSTMPMHKPDE